MSRFSFRRQPEAAAKAVDLVLPEPAVDEAPPKPSASFVIDQPVPELSSPRQSDAQLDMRLKIHARLIDEIDLSKLDKLDEAEMRRQVRKLVGDVARDERLPLNSS